MMRESRAAAEQLVAIGELFAYRLSRCSENEDWAMRAPEADPPSDYCGDRGAMMPKRPRTRAQNRAHRVAAERRHNHQARKARRTERAGHAGPTPPDPDGDPPPFEDRAASLGSAWVSRAQSDSLSCQPMRFGLVRVAEWQTR